MEIPSFLWGSPTSGNRVTVFFFLDCSFPFGKKVKKRFSSPARGSSFPAADFGFFRLGFHPWSSNKCVEQSRQAGVREVLCSPLQFQESLLMSSLNAQGSRWKWPPDAPGGSFYYSASGSGVFPSFALFLSPPSGPPGQAELFTFGWCFRRTLLWKGKTWQAGPEIPRERRGSPEL